VKTSDAVTILEIQRTTAAFAIGDVQVIRSGSLSALVSAER